MSDENQSTHAFDFELITDYYSTLKRQGPGSPEVTQKALSFIDNLTEDSKIADLGCGTGGQTMVLAEHCSGTITGIDLADNFIALLNAEIERENLQDRVKGLVGSIDRLPFHPEELDLIWSEGAIYNIGFASGLQKWRKFLKVGGYIAVTEASWFTEERPATIDRFWNEAYPKIDSIGNKVTQMQDAGFLPVATFVLPEECWTDHFYAPQVAAQDVFLKKHRGNKAAEALVQSERHEAFMYHKYKDYYGYVFYIGKKL